LPRSIAFATGLVSLLLAAAIPAGRAEPAVAAAVAIPLPSPGNVTVARLTLATSTAGGRVPRLALATRSGLSTDVVVAASITRTPGSKVARATVAIVDSTAPGSVRPTARARSVTVRLPAGFRLVQAAQVARDVLYQNALPGFPLVTGGTASILAAAFPPKLAPALIVRDAQLFALERSVPLVDVGLLGLQFVAVQLGQPSTTLNVTFGLTGLPQVNAVEFRFTQGIRVTKVSGPPATSGLPVTRGVQLISSAGFYQGGVSYSFKLELSSPPKRGDFVSVRASVHYFESSLPFTERFVVG
jgi:hypothetical protein